MTFVAAPFPAEAPYFRREFTSDGPPDRARLQVTALGIVEPYLNGTRVGDEVLAPGWTSYRHRLQVSTYDVTHLIRPGANALGAIVGEGWAAGRLGYEGKRHHYTQRPALYMRLELTHGGQTTIVTTDEQWTAGTGAVLAASLYDGETYDARREPDGWSLPGFTGAWSPAEPFDWDPGTLVPRVATPIRRIEELLPVETVVKDGRTIVDFGQNISGWVRLAVTGEAGQSVTIRHAEILRDGALDTETLRTARSTDRYTLRGGGQEVWEPRFTFHGFRYAEIDGPFDEVRAVVVHSDMRRTGWLDTSHDLLNRLHANTVWSMRGNFVGVPTDCPQRDERLGWTGDLNAFAPTAAFLYDVRGVLGSWLEDLAAEQREKGYVPWVVPDVLSTPSSPTALWSDVAVSLPWALYQEYGDTEILRRCHDSMAAFIRDVETRLDDDGLWSSGFQFGDWLDPDAPPDNAGEGKTGRHLVAAAYLAKTTREMADTARVLGTADAGHFASLAERTREAFRAEYVTGNGRVAGESATAYALAICFDLLDPAQEAHAGTRLAQLVAKAGFRISTGFAGTPLILPALSRTGHLQEAYLLLLETGCPSFLYPVTMGATTIWERWDAVLPDGTLNSTGMTSLNHYALGAVCDWLHKTIGGLTPLEPGYRRMRIAPKPGGGLTHATLTHTTVRGEVRIGWCVTDRFALEVTVPDGTHALVELPDGQITEITGGTHSFDCEPPGEDGPREPYTMDTPLKTLAGDLTVWRALREVFAKHFPGIPLDGTAPEAAVYSLNRIVGFIPGASEELKNDLRSALGGSR
ncbi:alpha-L-rhamnosidase [Streptosporangium becharense]|uniref:alpha-L-rhamnosidase n=1 Tax=Streptosporangium becharense TaxID=1816182 RepID=A0A7W9IMS4_9ACTN|nr:alpha-L-rhamnosidase [Streptosporangium becharense]MBB2914356.1 alpha-L-rhamnosidase [Streptosporangium becharense]MBB5823612.1 alpha-L-rhamnosidase [Streptosporangium becharense]